MSTRSTYGEEKAKVNAKWKYVVFTPEFGIDDALITAALAAVHLGAVGNFVALAETLRVTRDLARQGINPAKCFCSKFTVKHQRKVGDWRRFFRRGRWVTTHNGIVVYFARERR